MKKIFNFPQHFLIYFILCLQFVFFSCQTSSTIDEENHYAINNSQIYVTKIDLTKQNIQLVFYVNTDDFFSIQEFAQQTGATFAINTTPFFYDENNQAQLLGITKINGKIISNQINKYSALSFYFNDKNQLKAKIINTQSEEEIEKYPTVIGGYFTILNDGEVLQFKKNRRSRTAVGLSADGEMLYVLSVFSNLTSDLSGLTYMECAQILKNLGCTNAIQFDGGHSTALYSKEFGAVTTKNPRKIPAALGFFIPENE